MFKSILSLIFLCSFTVIGQWSPLKDCGTFINALTMNGKTIYASTNSKGILTSSDLKNWSPITGISCMNVGKLLIKNNKLSAAATFNQGIFFNNTTSWSCASSLGNVQDFVQYALQGKTITLAVTTSGIYKSTNTTTWTLLKAGYFSSITMNGATIYVSSYNAGVIYSTNNGTTWTSINTGLPTLTINKIIFIGSTLYVGTNFKGLYSYIATTTKVNKKNVTTCSWKPAGLNSLNITTIIPYSKYTFVGTSTNGVYMSTNGTTWTAINESLIDKAIYSITTNGTNVYVGGAQGIIYTRTLANIIKPPKLAKTINDTPQLENTKIVSHSPTTISYYNMKGQLINAQTFSYIPTSISIKHLATGTYIQAIKTTGMKFKTNMITIK